MRVKGRDMSAEELASETVEEQITLGRTGRKDGGRQTIEESAIVTYLSREGGDEGGQG